MRCHEDVQVRLSSKSPSRLSLIYAVLRFTDKRVEQPSKDYPHQQLQFRPKAPMKTRLKPFSNAQDTHWMSPQVNLWHADPVFPHLYKESSFLGQRKYGGPPPNWESAPPGNGCEVFCGKIPKDMYEDELIPLFEKCGTIWDLRLMMDPMTGTNRGYAFITFTGREAAYNAVREVSSARPLI